MDSAKQLRDLSKIYMEAVYGGKKKDTAMVVTNADKKANTPAYQNLKKGVKGYVAADHMKEGHSADTEGKKNCGCGQDPCVTYGDKNLTQVQKVEEQKKAEKDFDGDGKLESPESEYKGSKDKAIKKELKDLEKAGNTLKGKFVAKADKVKAVGESRRWWDVDVIEEQKAESSEEEEEKDKEDDDLFGSPNKKKKKGHDCATKVKHEEYGMGECIKEMHTLDEDGNVSHYDVLFGHGLEKNVDVSALEVLEGMYHEHAINHEKNMELQEQQKDTPDQVAAVIDMYRSKKGTDEATKDSLEGKKKAAKKERDYAKWERDKMARDAQKSGHPWKHAKGSTTEKEGKKSVKHAHVQDSYDWQNESKEAEEYLNTVSDVKDAELKADIKRWSAIEESGKFTKEEIESIKEADRLGKSEVYILDEVDDDLLQFVESSLGNFPEDQILDMMESMYHRRNPGKKHPLESGSSKVTPRPVSDKEKKSTDKEDRMYVAMRRVKDRQKGYDKDKSDAADRLHGHYTSRQSARKKGASSKEAAAGSHGDFGSKGFNIKRGGRKGLAPRTDRGTGNKAARRAGQEVKNRDPRK